MSYIQYMAYCKTRDVRDQMDEVEDTIDLVERKAMEMRAGYCAKLLEEFGEELDAMEDQYKNIDDDIDLCVESITEKFEIKPREDISSDEESMSSCISTASWLS